MSWGIVASVGAAVVGSAISADAAGDAADAQSQAASDDRALQKQIFDKQVELNEPFRQSGIAAQNRLSYLLGLSPTGGGSTGGSPMETSQQIRDRLLAQYTRGGSSATSPVSQNFWQTSGGTQQQTFPVVVGYTNDEAQQPIYQNFPVGMASQTIDEAGLSSAVEAEMQRQRAASQGAADAQRAAAEKDPAYGSLMRDFSMADFQADPGYAFRMEEGQKALDRSASARGGLYSGRAAKDLLRFGQGLGAQEYGNAYNRFQINRSNKLNPLQSMAGVGQTATGQVQTAAQNYATGAGSAIQQGGNARASGYVGRANALNTGIGQATNAWQQYNLLRQQPTYGGGGWSSTSGWGAGINPSSGEYMGSLEF